jgi:predicted DNA-binding mobile mystery protein A
MKRQHRHIVREQLETTVEKFFFLRNVNRPATGWLRAIREALGMPGKQFAKRLGVSAPWISNLEKNELAGSVTIKTMHQAANALDCDFVYALIPRKKLEEIVRERAISLARKKLARVSHTMLLEAQQLSMAEERRAFEAEVEELIRNMPKELWDDHNEI